MPTPEQVAAAAAQVQSASQLINGAVGDLPHEIVMSALLSLFRAGALANPCCLNGSVGLVERVLAELRLAQSAALSAARQVH